jgi:hypothetical protein
LSIWDYFRSVVIFLAATWFVNDALGVDLLRSVILVLLMAVCVFHTMDIRDDIMKKVAKKREKKNDATG